MNLAEMKYAVVSDILPRFLQLVRSKMAKFHSVFFSRLLKTFDNPVFDKSVC